MACLAEEFGFVVAPRLDSPLGMPRHSATAGAFEMCFFRLSFRHELANQGQDNNANNYSSDDEFR
jgi:hypothetical protein